LHQVLDCIEKPEPEAASTDPNLDDIPFNPDAEATPEPTATTPVAPPEGETPPDPPKRPRGRPPKPVVDERSPLWKAIAGTLTDGKMTPEQFDELCDREIGGPLTAGSPMDDLRKIAAALECVPAAS
jgi:hypothetical protein